MRKILTLVVMIAAMLGIQAKADCYLLGELEGGAWDPATGGVAVPATATEGVYQGDFTFTGNCYFGVATQMSTLSGNDGWADLNGNYRYVPADGDAAPAIATEGSTTVAMLGPGNGDKSFHVAAPGTYTITVDFNAMTVTGQPKSVDPLPEPGPITNTGAYLIGQVNGNSWNYNVGVALTAQSEGVYSGDVTFAANSYFSVATTLEATGWDDLNANYRFGPAANDEPVQVGTAMPITKIANNAWKMEAAGEYTVTVDFNANTILVAAKGEPTPGPTPTLPEELYILGQVEGSDWTPGMGLAFTKTADGIFDGDFVINSTFGLITNNDATLSWDDLNASYRVYPKESEGDYGVHEGEMALGWTNNGGEAWKVDEANRYAIHVDLNTMTMTATAIVEPLPGPTVDALYILGQVEGSDWALPGHGLQLEKKSDGVFEGSFTINGTFGFITDNEEADWDQLVGLGKRYGNPEGDNLTVALDAPVAIGLNGNAWAIPAAGVYTVTVDINANTLTVVAGGEPIPGPGPVPTTGAFLLGELEGGAWDPATGGVAVPATATEGVYEGTFTINGYFGVASQMSTLTGDEGWADLNANYRFVPAEGDAAPVIATEGTTTVAMLGPGNGDKSFNVAAPGQYKITIDYNAMTVTGEYVGEAPIPGPGPTPTGDVFILGEVEGSDWNIPGYGLPLTKTAEGVYEGDFTINAAFAFITNNECDNWDELNANFRYGPAVDGEAVTFGTPMSLNVVPGMGSAWNIGTPGTYHVTVDLNALTVVVGEGTPTPIPAGDVFILGEVEGSDWNIPGYGLPLTKTAEGIYEGEFGINGSFAFITNNECDNWDELNANFRYGPAVDGEVTTFDTPMSLNVVPGMGSAWQIGTPGIYHVTVNLNTLTVVVGEGTPTPIPAGEVYILGDVEGSAWDYAGMGLPLAQVSEGIYEGDFGINAYFCITTTNEASSWEDLNASYRFGPEIPDSEVLFNEAMPMFSGIDSSWNIVTPGFYTVTVDMNNKTITVKEASGISTVGVDAAIRGIYNLQGQRVRETVPGQLYIINGKKVIARTVITDY